ncbi:MAG: hypothetical protein LBN38_03030 [Verrucomicrobiota bacterium]|nr:hypothetical protein [Verrucomicrobiota bacterium]
MPHALCMDAPSSHSIGENRKVIRISQAEAYALRIPTARKKKKPCGCLGLVLLLILGGGLWHFREHGLSYFQKETAPAFPADAFPPPPASAPPEEIEVDLPVEGHLSYLSAAGWDNETFRSGVRIFNRAVDAYRHFPEDADTLTPLAEGEQDVIQAARLFATLRKDAPAEVSLEAYLQACRDLLAAFRERAAAFELPPSFIAQPFDPVPPPPPARPATASSQKWTHPDLEEGARLFNQALAQYQQFLRDKSRTDLLPAVEESAYQAAKKFEGLRDVAPETVPLDQHITQSYKLISDSRRQHLEAAQNEKPTRIRRTTGPRRRPALPAYQPP